MVKSFNKNYYFVYKVILFQKYHFVFIFCKPYQLIWNLLNFLVVNFRGTVLKMFCSFKFYIYSFKQVWHFNQIYLIYQDFFVIQNVFIFVVSYTKRTNEEKFSVWQCKNKYVTHINFKVTNIHLINSTGFNLLYINLYFKKTCVKSLRKCHCCLIVYWCIYQL